LIEVVGNKKNLLFSFIFSIVIMASSEKKVFFYALIAILLTVSGAIAKKSLTFKSELDKSNSPWKQMTIRRDQVIDDHPSGRVRRQTFTAPAAPARDSLPKLPSNSTSVVSSLSAGRQFPELINFKNYSFH